MFNALPQQRTFEVLVKQIKEVIYSGKLKPGDKLPTERELAQIFKVSRAAVRSAMLNLEQSGVLEIKKGAAGGFFIRDLDYKPVRESLHDLIMLGQASMSHLSEARRIIEPEAAGLAALRATSSDIADLEKALVVLQSRAEGHSAPEPSDLQFHVGVAQAAKNPVILIIMRSLMDLLFQSIASYVLDRGQSNVIVAQHRTILKAIKAGKAEQARTAMLEHVTAMNLLFSNLPVSENRKIID